MEMAFQGNIEHTRCQFESVLFLMALFLNFCSICGKKPVFRYEYYVKHLYFSNIQCLKWPEALLRKDISLWRHLPVSYFSLLVFEGWSERYNSKDTLSLDSVH